VLRSVKYGLHGAVLAGLVALPALWNSVDKSVDLVVDGQGHAVHTTAQKVGDVLAGQGYRLTAHDLLAPAASSPVADGTRIVLRRGRLLHLDVDGTRTDVWTTAPTVAQALADLGYSSGDFFSGSRSRRLPLGVTDIAIRTPRLITIVHDGKREQVTTTEGTVGGVLSDLQLSLGPNDRLSVPAGALVRTGELIRIERVSKRLVTRLQSVPFPVVKRKDPTMLAGSTKIITPGAKGRARAIYAVIYIDGKLAGRTLVRSVVFVKPQRQVEKVGTKRPAVQLAPNAPAPSPGTAKAIARDLLAKRGWGSTQYDCLVTLWDNESGWNVHAENSSTGAYGIPQALPGSKMSTAGPDWQNNATTQITWGLGYIADRYNTPCGAWSYWQGAGWY
jgi:resuscitation-promoting factor RpfB